MMGKHGSDSHLGAFKKVQRIEQLAQIAAIKMFAETFGASL